METHSGGSGTGVLERLIVPAANYTPQTDKVPEEIGDTPKNPRGGYLTIFENPLYMGFLGILMSSKKTDVDGGHVFFDNYMIRAFGDIIDKPIFEFKYAINKHQNENPAYFTLEFAKGDNTGITYPVASEVPLIPCEITADEFSQFEANIKYKRLNEIIKDMVTLIVGGSTEFELVNDILVLPQNYASKLLL